MIRRDFTEGAVYQIYPRSFYDSNGDGIGDLQGITQKLDYVASLGVKTIWISPFFKSPQKDFGYDISDFLDVDPVYGTLGDADELIAQAHRKNLKVLLDMVLNHTSDEHPWFLESCVSRDNPRRDWYVWRDGKGGAKPPNNWRSKVGGGGWRFHKESGQWYWASFLPFQPDLNYRNPEVRTAVLEVLRFWLDRGADGFRFDILGCLFEDEAFRDNPLSFKFFPGGGEPGMLFRSAIMTENHPDTLDFTAELKKTADAYSGAPRFLIGEVFGALPTLASYCAPRGKPGLDGVFMFEAMDLPLKAAAWRKFLRSWLKSFGAPDMSGASAWVRSNHDRARFISLHGGDERKARLALLIHAALPGIPVIYYGEEIGMRQSDIPMEESKDAVAQRFLKLPRVIRRFLLVLTRFAIHRDGCRTPMQWDGTKNAGFCPAHVSPWLPVGPLSERINVEAEKKDANSMLAFTSALLMVRNSYKELRESNFRLFPPLGNTAILAFERGNIRIYANFSGKKKFLVCKKKEMRLLASTRIPPADWGAVIHGEGLNLAPWEAVVCRRFDPGKENQ